MKKGFTLVELSVVLVIIGLLIGGILVAQSMIESAEVQKFARQMGEMKAAVRNFKAKYNYLPGDSPFHSAAGDGDGRIETVDLDAGTAPYTTKFDGETSNFWVHLQQDGFLDKEYPAFSNDASGGTDIITHIPKSAMGTKDAGILPMYHNSTLFARGHYFKICDYSVTTGTSLLGSTIKSVFTPIEALAIDTKMDDGLTGAGLSGGGGYLGDVVYFNWVDGTAGGTLAGTCIASSNPYGYLPNNNLECCLMIAMDDRQ